MCRSVEAMKITGNVPTVQRLVTDFWSFDRAFENQRGDIGFPLGTNIEIFGPHSSGKSTTTYGLAGMIGKHLECDIALLDLEGFDPIFLMDVLQNVAFDGELQYLQRPEDEDAMDLLVSTVGDKKKNFGIGILDSIGAISPIAEAEGDLGEANMGKRAKLVGQFFRKSTKVIRDYKNKNTDKTFIAINHQLPVLGGRGTYTPGGLAKEYLTGIRIQLKIAYAKNKWEIFPDSSYVIEGKVVKNKLGMKSRIFHLFMLNGKGVHKGLTWMYDGWVNKVVTRDSFIGNVKVGDKQIGKMKEIVTKAHDGEEEFFHVFRDALAGIDNTQPDRDIEDDEGDAEDTDNTDSPTNGDE